MDNQLNDIERKARLLPVADGRLTRNLFESVHDKEISEIDKAWIAVAEERSAAYRWRKDAGIDEVSFFAEIEYTFE